MSKTQQVLFGMLGVLAISIAVGVGTFYMMRGQLKEKSEEVAELKIEKEVISEQISVYRDAQKKVEDLSYIEDIAEAVLPDTKDQAEGIAELRKFADESGVTIETISFGGSVAADASELEISQTIAITGLSGVRFLPTTIQFQPGASFSQVLKFMEKIENNQRKMQITNVSLTPSETDPQQLTSSIIDINLLLKG